MRDQQAAKHKRLLAVATSLAVGAALTSCTGGTGGAVLSALLPEMAKRIPGTLDGIAGGIFATQIEHFASGSTQTPDLDRMVGHAIGGILTRVSADVGGDSQQQLVQSLGEWTPTYWSDVETAALGERELVKALKKRPGEHRLGEVLSVEAWREVVQAINQKYVEDNAFVPKEATSRYVSQLKFKLQPRTVYERKVRRRREQIAFRKQKLNSDVRTALAKRLQDDFPDGLRDVLARDAAHGGRAFGSVVIQILEGILNLTGRTLKEVQATGAGVRDLQETHQRLLAQSNRILQEFEGNRSAVDGEVLEALRVAVGSVQETASLLGQLSAELREGVHICRTLRRDERNLGVGLPADPPPETESQPSSLSELISDREWTRDPWSKLLSAVNGRVLKLYREATGMQGPAETQELDAEQEMWARRVATRRAWDPYLEDLKHWVEVRDEVSSDPAHARATTLLLDAASSPSQPLRLWIVAEPGTGKTVLLYRTFFQVIEMRARGEDRLPQPLLIQPQLLRSDLIQRLNETPQSDLLGVLVQIWLENRSIEATEDQLAVLTRGLERHLDDGTVALFVDSFDELNRMQVQRHLVQGLFCHARRFVCASRMEAYRSVQGEWTLRSSQEIRLAPFWSLETIRNYLSKRFHSYETEIESFIKTVRSHEKAEHLRNARYLSLLVDLFQRGYGLSSRASTDSRVRPDRSELGDFLSAVQYGEYELLTTLYDLVAESALRIAEGRGIRDDQMKARLRRAFEDIAKGQLLNGSYAIPIEMVEGSEVGIWTVVAGCKDFLRPLARKGGDYQLRLKNFTLIDFFLARPIADELCERDSGEPLSFRHLWSSDLLLFLSSELRGRRPERSASLQCDQLWQRLHVLRMNPDAVGPGSPCREAEVDEDRRFQAINLLHLGLRLTQDAIDPRGEQSPANVRASITLSGRPDFSDLYLEEADLSRLSFEGCCFDRSVLRNANLEDARFFGCSFRQSNLRQARAAFATFADCTFDFHEQAGARKRDNAANPGEHAVPKDGLSADSPSPVDGMLMHHARVDDLFSDESGFGLKTFRDHGAQMYGSRYTGPFGRKFMQKQSAFLGSGVQKALRGYIQTAKDAVSPSDPVYLVDLMAGGVSGLKEKLFKGADNLQILAIDRDTHQLRDLSDEIGSRYKVRQEEIAGRLGLSDLLSTYLEVSRADIIIGKKALHELPREQQRALIQECAEVLRPDGSLIILADAPRTISEEAYDRLQRLAAPLRESIHGGSVDWKTFQTRYVDRLSFTATEDAAAVFSNLWVHLKDWANGNEHEVKHRYFSSAEEIRGWATAVAGLTEPTQHAPFHYTLASRRFNEKGFNWVGRYLDRTGGVIRRGDQASIRNHLLGGRRHELFYRFSDCHLWDEEQGAPTELGAFLKASTVPVSFSDFVEDGVAKEMAQIELPSAYDRVPAFQFSVHLLHFTKKSSGGSASRQKQV